MTTLLTAVRTIASPRPQGLPSGMEAFRVRGTGTGTAAAATVEMQIYFSPSASGAFVNPLYVALYDVELETPSAMVCSIQCAGSQDWENYRSLVGPGVTSVLGTTRYVARLVRPDAPVYLGGQLKGGLARLLFNAATETNGAAYHLSVRGYLSDQPFVLPRWFG